MEANILNGVYVRVAGEAGKTNGLPWHILENMFGHLQELISALAKYELDSDASPKLEEFEIELFDFKPGSAVPAFRLVPKQQMELVPVLEEQKLIVAHKFDELMSYANKGDYQSFFSPGQLPEVRYEIAEELYGFIRSAEGSPLSIVEPVNDTGEYREVYRVPRFTKEQADVLLRPKRRRKAEEEPEEIFALVQRVGKRRKIVDLYENKDTQLSIAPATIVLDKITYVLHSPLVCTVHKEEENFIIENDMLDLYAVGADIDEAEHDLYAEFDSSFKLLNSMSDNELSERLLRAKRMMNSYVKEIITE